MIVCVFTVIHSTFVRVLMLYVHGDGFDFHNAALSLKGKLDRG